jgi:hypothetical protein
MADPTFDPSAAYQPEQPSFDASKPFTKQEGRISRLGTKPANPGIMDRLKSAIFIPEAQRKAEIADDAKATGGDMGAVVGRGLVEMGKEAVKQTGDAIGQVAKDFEPTTDPAQLQHDFDPITGPLMDMAGVAVAPLTGAITGAVGKPVEELTGVRREITGNALAMLAPGGEAKAAKIAADAGDIGKAKNTLKAATAAADSVVSAAEPEHAAKVARLTAEGVEPTAGQLKGGQIRRFEEAHKSDPLIGHAIRKQEDHALQTFNRALYNRVLKPIGQSVSKTIPIGRDAVKAVGDRVSAEYEKLKPQMRLVPDDQSIDELAAIRSRVGELPPPQQAQFEAILNNRVLHRLGNTGEMDGEVFKLTESDLTRMAREYKGAQDPALRGLGHAIEDVTGVLRDNLERTSEPEIRPALKNANSSWALLTRLEDAAQARKGSGGLVTPGDLLGAVRKGDRTVRHRAFARGDAPLQKFGEDGFDVLGNKLPDSGTAERLNVTRPHGLAMYALSHATTPLAGAGMNLLKRFAAHAPGTRNYLLSDVKRLAPRAARANNLANLLGTTSPQPAGQ